MGSRPAYDSPMSNYYRSAPSARMYQWILSSYRDIWYFGAIDNKFYTVLASTISRQSSFFFSLVAFAVGARLLSGGDEAWWVSCFLGAMRGAGLGRVLPTWAALRAVTEQAATSSARQNGRCILSVEERKVQNQTRGKVPPIHARDEPSF